MEEAAEWSIFFAVMIYRIREPWICANDGGARELKWNNVWIYVE